ncbi:hypothetical protein GWI33_007221 [Rhynchophorus ferrugineus]|uniref:Uncharacterized protein n=1 Tax=Rhynchophorus ferrugineus TaxID=354439 RepID=A0A834IHX2_RHYFE|nr:hypothetical protein GWI33_007221 [Rhynchophorus ferrugineus]
MAVPNPEPRPVGPRARCCICTSSGARSYLSGTPYSADLVTAAAFAPNERQSVVNVNERVHQGVAESGVLWMISED